MFCLLGSQLTVLATVSLAQERLEEREARALREAMALAAPSVVRIETIGGREVVGELLASRAPTTGVIVDEGGWIITSSFNFANNPASVLVTTPDGRRHPANVMASDESRMLTLLKIDAGGLSPLVAAPRDEISVGQWAIALGRTYDQPFPNVSVGIISATGRIWGRALQSDAKISPANYGGPLVDIHGRGMGILVPLSPEETDQTAGVEWYDSGIGFAVPLEDVYNVLHRLKSEESLKPGLMGVGFASRSPISGAAVIERVRPGSPADEAGLEVGDTITEIDGATVRRVPDLRHVLGRKYAGDTVALHVERDGETVAVRVTLASELSAYQRPILGILAERSTAGMESADGVGIRVVLPETPADRASLKSGERILTVNQVPVEDSRSLAEAVRRHRVGDVIALELSEKNETRTVEVTLAAMSGDLPDSLPTFEIPRPTETDDGEPAVGRIVESLGGVDDRQFWAYVPDGYHDAYSYGLAIWLHPPGDTMEAQMLKAWRTHCNRRGIILVGPKTARAAGWTPPDMAFIEDLIGEFEDRYAIDPTRIVVQSMAGSAPFAAMFAFRERETIRGLSLVDAALPIRPPETDPDAPLQFHFVRGNRTAGADAFDQGISRLRELAFPVTLHEAGDLADFSFTGEVAEKIALWIDALDRI